MPKNDKKTPKTRTRVAKAAKKVTSKKVKTSKPAKAKSTSSVLAAVKTYPFESKREIAHRIIDSDKEAVAALTQLHQLDAGMCSQKKAIATLAGRVAEAGEGAASDAALVSDCREMALHYTRRLAKESRAKALQSNPELSELADLFSATA